MIVTRAMNEYIVQLCLLIHLQKFVVYLCFSPLMLRWWQPGGYPYNFALDDVYIGPPCPEHCHRNGPCKHNACSCDIRTSGIASIELCYMYGLLRSEILTEDNFSLFRVLTFACLFRVINKEKKSSLLV